jgi:hypothetical protein
MSWPSQQQTSKGDAHMKSQTALKAIAFLLLSGAVAAQEASEQWDVRAAIYAFVPDIGGETRFTAPGGGEFDIQSDDLVRNTELAGMAAIEAQKGLLRRPDLHGRRRRDHGLHNARPGQRAAATRSNG